MRRIEVQPTALPSAADALRRFAAEIDGAPPLPGLPAPLAEAATELVRVTARDIAELGAQAQRDAAHVLAAADLYQQLEVLLVPGALR